jgi:hypothetical protein
MPGKKQPDCALCCDTGLVVLGGIKELCWAVGCQAKYDRAPELEAERRQRQAFYCWPA